MLESKTEITGKGACQEEVALGYRVLFNIRVAIICENERLIIEIYFLCEKHWRRFCKLA